MEAASEQEWGLVANRIAAHTDYFRHVLSLLPVLGEETEKGKRAKKSGKKVNEGQSEDSSEDNDVQGETIQGFATTVPQDELKQRMQEKIQSFKQKRKVSDLDDPNQQGRAKKQKISDSKSVSKNEKGEKNSKNSKSKPKNKPSKAGNQDKPGQKKEKQDETKKLQKSNSDLTTNLDKLEFAFDASSGSAVPAYLQQRKKLSKARLLASAQSKKKQLDSLKGTEEGTKIEEKQAWGAMMKRAEGESVLDDISKLKKSVKRLEGKKKKSSKEWDSRISLQHKSQRDAQAQRKANLDERKQGKKDKKMGIKKPNKQRPGFEGRKRNFINK